LNDCRGIAFTITDWRGSDAKKTADPRFTPACPKGVILVYVDFWDEADMNRRFIKD